MPRVLFCLLGLSWFIHPVELLPTKGLKLVLVEISRNFTCKVVSVSPRNRAADRVQAGRQNGEIRVSYSTPEGTIDWGTINRGPDLGCHRQPLVHAIEVPEEAFSLNIRPPSPWASSTLTIPDRRNKFLVMGGKYSTGPPLRLPFVESLNAPPDMTKNLIFVSSGFTAGEKGIFMACVLFIVQFMRGTQPQGTATNLMSSPWDRYVELMNVYAVFEPSQEGGASIPSKSDGSQWDGYPPRTRKTNLNCIYGSDQLRFLHCDHGLSLGLAYSNVPAPPDQSVVHVIVNSDLYGGTGGGGIDFLYSGRWKSCTSGDCIDVCLDEAHPFATCPQDLRRSYLPEDDNKIANLFIHEQGHADGGLLDEYSHNVEGDDSIRTPNCDKDSNPSWRHWIGNPIGVGKPSNVGDCTFTGYYRPTQDACLMSAERTQLCAVCAEHTQLRILDSLKTLVSPRVPRASETMVVWKGSSVNYLSVRELFLQGPNSLTSGEFADSTRVNSKSQRVDVLQGKYPPCTGAKRFYVTSRGNYGNDDPQCTVTADINDKRIPVRLDTGDIQHTWFWPLTAGTKPPPQTTETGFSQPWTKRNIDGIDRHIMAGNMDNQFNPVSAGVIPILEFTGEALGCGAHEFEFVVWDRTTFINTDVHNVTEKLLFKAVFRVFVTHSICLPLPGERFPFNDSRHFSHCNGDILDNLNATSTTSDEFLRSKFVNRNPLASRFGFSQSVYCSVCDEGSLCNDTYPNLPYEARANVGALVDEIEKKFAGLIGGIAGCIFLLVILICIIVARLTADKLAKRIMPAFVQGCRWVLVVLSCLIMIQAILVVVYGGLNYQKFSVYGKAIVVGLGAVEAFFFITATIGFVAPIFKSKFMLVINGIILTIKLFGAIFILVLVVTVTKSVTQSDEGKSSSITRRLKSYWISSVKDNPKAVCSFQSRFQCSGLTASCHNVKHEQCPVNCEVTNSAYPDSCYGEFVRQWKEHSTKVIVGVSVLVALFLFAVICNWTLRCYLRKRKNKVGYIESELTDVRDR